MGSEGRGGVKSGTVSINQPGEACMQVRRGETRRRHYSSPRPPPRVGLERGLGNLRPKGWGRTRAGGGVGSLRPGHHGGGRGRIPRRSCHGTVRRHGSRGSGSRGRGVLMR